jgi:cell division protease FtsH
MRKPQRPAKGLSYEGGRPRDEDIPTRKPLSLWDRVKFLLLLAIIWVLLVWSVMANNPLVGFVDAVKIEVRAGYWVFILAGLEAVRQIHYLISERWGGYNQFWIRAVFGRTERLTRRKPPSSPARLSTPRRSSRC